jgi:hypothetical protein
VTEPLEPTPPSPSAVLPLSAGPLYISIFGRKGSGKSELARILFLAYPFDRLVVDPTGDVSKALPPGSFRDALPTDFMHRPATHGVPAKWPKRDDEKRSSLLYHPRRSSPTYATDLNTVCGWPLAHAGDCMIWYDEGGRTHKRDHIEPNAHEIEEEGRHHGITRMLCSPRVSGLDGLVIHQSDIIYIFALPAPTDRQQLASIMGYDTEELSDAIDALPQFGYLRFSQKEHEDSGLRLVEFDPLPSEWVSHATRA